MISMKGKNNAQLRNKIKGNSLQNNTEVKIRNKQEGVTTLLTN